MIDLVAIERMFDICKRLRDERRKAEKLSERARNADAGKPSQKATVDLNWQAMHVVKLEADLHAAAVDAGIADRREETHYEERVARPSAWHDYPWTPAQPRKPT